VAVAVEDVAYRVEEPYGLLYATSVQIRRVLNLRGAR